MMEAIFVEAQHFPDGSGHAWRLIEEAALVNSYTVPKTGYARTFSPAEFTIRAGLQRFESVAGLIEAGPRPLLENEIEREIRGVHHRRTRADAAPFEVNQILGETLGTFDCLCRFTDPELQFNLGPSPKPETFAPITAHRFAILEAGFDFGNGDHASGAGEGCTYRVNDGCERVLLCAGAGAVSSASGRLAGLPGTFAINGRLEPGAGFAGLVTCRFLDRGSRVRTERQINPPLGYPDAPQAAFLQIRVTHQGSAPALAEARAARLISARYGHRGLQTRVVLGPKIGNVRVETDADEHVARSYEYRFDDTAGMCAGTLVARVDGSAVSAETECRRGGRQFAAYGPIGSGSGVFEGVTGVFTETSAAGGTFNSLMHTLQVIDPGGRYRRRG